MWYTERFKEDVASWFRVHGFADAERKAFISGVVAAGQRGQQKYHGFRFKPYVDPLSQATHFARVDESVVEFVNWEKFNNAREQDRLVAQDQRDKASWKASNKGKQWASENLEEAVLFAAGFCARDIESGSFNLNRKPARAVDLFNRCCQSYPDLTSFHRQMKAVRTPGLYFSNSYLRVGDTPGVLKQFGFDDKRPLVIAKGKALSTGAWQGAAVSGNKHNLSLATYTALPDALTHPAVIMQSQNKDAPNTLIFLTSLVDRQGFPIVACIKEAEHTKLYNQECPSNIVMTVYGKVKYFNFVKQSFEDNRVLYVDKKESRELSNRHGLQLPDKVFMANDFSRSIAQFRENFHSEKIDCERAAKDPQKKEQNTEDFKFGGIMDRVNNANCKIRENEGAGGDRVRITKGKEPDGWDIGG